MSVGDERYGATAVRADQLALRCATCEIPVTSETFCCAGCVGFGPCISTHDATVEEAQGALGSPRNGAHWPIDARVMLDLLARIQRLACEATAGDDTDHRRRLDGLREQSSSVSVTFDPEVAAIGRRVTIRGEDERVESFWLALPGDEHATADTVSIAAPTGRSLAGARVGDVVYVETDGRRRWAVVLHVA